MRATLRHILLLISLFLLVLFILFVINQTVQVVSLARQLNPWLAKAVLWILITVYAVLILLPVYLFIRLPKALRPPEDDQTPDFDRYLQRVAKRLRRNPRVEGIVLDSREAIEQALKKLETGADLLIKKNATTVFITTAISQSGRLDAFTVLITQFRMVWQIAHHYDQRPSLREMAQLYANVAATTFVAGELDDLDIDQQVEPIIASVLGSTLTSAIPGVSTVAVIITNSLLTGSANAYLTLRVGAIAKQYCGSLLKRERRLIRRSASLEAARMVSAIVMSSAGNITRSIVNAAMKSPGRLSRSVIKSSWKKISAKKRSELE
jgi:uncharacterized membrane protein YcjF (UPF0283 family)